MPDSTRVVTKVLGAQQDLLIGEGKAEQTRAGQSYTVDKLRLLYLANSMDEVSELDPTMFPKVLLLENGSYYLLVFDGAVYTRVPQLTTILNITDQTIINAVAAETVVVSATVPTTITNIISGNNGQRMHIIATTANTTIANNATIRLRGGVNLAIPIGTGITLVFITSVGWAEV